MVKTLYNCSILVYISTILNIIIIWRIFRTKRDDKYGFSHQEFKTNKNKLCFRRHRVPITHPYVQPHMPQGKIDFTTRILTYTVYICWHLHYISSIFRVVTTINIYIYVYIGKENENLKQFSQNHMSKTNFITSTIYCQS